MSMRINLIVPIIGILKDCKVYIKKYKSNDKDENIMLKFENTFCDWIEKNLFEISIIMITILSFLVRYCFRNVVSADMSVSLLPWYDTIKENGGIKALEYQVGNYNLIYQFLIALMTYGAMSRFSTN